MGLALRAVTVRDLALLEHKVVCIIFLRKFSKGDGGVALLIQNLQIAVLIGLARPDGLIALSDGEVVVTNGIQVKRNILHRIPDLIHLCDLALRNGRQVELQAQVGVCIAPLQIEKFQGVIGAVGEGVACSVVAPSHLAFLACGPEHFS